jgi:hypothetical protein
MAASVGNRYTTTGYTAKLGDVYKIRISNNARAAQPTADTGKDPTRAGTALVGGSRKRRGVHARGFRLVRKTGTSPNIVSFYTFLPILLPADYDAKNDGETITVNGVDWTIESHVAEVLK